MNSSQPRVSELLGGVSRGGEIIGLYTSQLQQHIDTAFDPVTNDDWKTHSMVNASVLRYLKLSGTYFADQPLRIPSLFVLELNGALIPAANLSLADTSKYTAMVELVNVSFSAVIGGVYDCSSLPVVDGRNGYQAITIVGGGKNAVRSVRASASSSESAISVNKSPHAEVSYCNVGGSATAVSVGRAIWCLATNKALIHDNFVHHVSMHAIDFDAYTSLSLAYNNLCEYNQQEGIFVEETASKNMVMNNTCRFNQVGIALYSSVVGPVQDNFVVNNVLVENKLEGLSSGGYGHDPNLMSYHNVFASNLIINNGPGKAGAQTNVDHGSAQGTYWTDNTFAANNPMVPNYGNVPRDSGSVAIFEPSSGDSRSAVQLSSMFMAQLNSSGT